MLIVETIARIRREHFIKGKTIKEIARDLKVSRNTVRKVLRSGETSFEYERVVQPRPKLGRWAAELDGLLAANAAKSAREQLTLIRIFEELRGRGYDGGYDAVRRYARRWSKERGQSTAAAYVPLSFAPGEAYQFDWSHEVVLLNGVTVIVKAAHVRLCHSRMLFVRCYPRETQEMVFDAHDRAFALFKGTCGRGIYDNMKTAVETIYPEKQTDSEPIGTSHLCQCRKWLASFDHLVGACEQSRWDSHAKSLGSPKIDHEIKFGWLLNGNVTRLGATQNSVDETGSASIKVCEIGTIGNQTSSFRMLPRVVDRRHFRSHDQQVNLCAVGIR